MRVYERTGLDHNSRRQVFDPHERVMSVAVEFAVTGRQYAGVFDPHEG